MSKVVKLNLQVTQPAILHEVAAELNLPVQENTTVQYFGNRTRTGTAISLPGWNYPVVVDAEGNIHYDNYEGHWGDPAQLQALTQAYSRAVVLANLRQQGFEYPIYTEEEEEDGTLVLTVTVGGGW